MKKLNLILTTFMLSFFMMSCQDSLKEKAKKSVKLYLKDNLKNSESYKAISFSKIDTLQKPDTLYNKTISFYKITHNYSVVNSDKELVKKNITFYLDKDLKVNNTNTNNINGDFGILTGNIFWKYNDYIGNKPDAGAEIILYSLDSLETDFLKFKTFADLNGNYKLEKIPSGVYFLIIKSENTRDCPSIHLLNFKLYNSELNKLFGFNINDYRLELEQINTLDSLASSSLYLKNPSKALYDYERYKKQSENKADEFFSKIPYKFKKDINFSGKYSKSYYFSHIIIEEGKVEYIVTDFGITCI